ncbi:MAG TPA: hypothetical protein ENI42_03445 [Thermoplasmatales archaeon]|nr:hypothetical protein [Thermoplasmatales archaeon]
MKKKFVSLFAAVVIVSAALTPVVNARMFQRRDNQTVSVVTCIYQRYGVKEVVTEVSEQEAYEIKQCLEQLNYALGEGDEKKVLTLVSLLREKRLFNETLSEMNLALHGLDVFSGEEGKTLSFFSKKVLSTAETNISNFLCYVHATGRGLMFFTIGHILLVLASMGLILPIQFYLLILILTHLIPLRVLLPIGSISLEEGKISTFGLGGFQTVEAVNETVGVTLLGFTGVTINIPFGETQGFLFVSGFSLLAFSGSGFSGK